MMSDMGHEVPCGICYEESRKKNEGKFAETWLNGQTDKEWNQKLKDYDKKVTGDPSRRSAASVNIDDLRAWMDALYKMVVKELESKKSNDV